MIDWNAVGTLAGSVGGFALVGKWLIKNAEKTSETLPVILANLKELNESVQELFKSRNLHSERIVKLETSAEHCEFCNSWKHRRASDLTKGD